MTKQLDQIKEDIRRLYVDEGKPLEEVMRIISESHDYHASERTYKSRLKEWGFTTYHKAESSSAPTRPRKRYRQRSATPPEESAELITSTEINASQHAPDQLGEKFEDQLHQAVKAQSHSQVARLLSAGAPTEVQDNDGYMPLHYAVMRDSTEIVELLLNHGADLYSPAKDLNTALDLARHSPVMLRALLEHKIDFNMPMTDGDCKSMPLISLVLFYDFDQTDWAAKAFDLLLESGADVNQTDDFFGSSTPLHILLSKKSASDGSPTCLAIKNALQAGAHATGTFLFMDENEMLQPRTPFQVFSSRYCNVPWTFPETKSSITSIFKLFLTKGANPNTRLPNGELVFDNLLRLHLSEDNVSPYGEVLEMLLTKLDLTIPRLFSNHLLHVLVGSSASKTTNLMEIALERGCSPNVFDDHGRTPLEILASSPPTECSNLEVLNRIRLLLRFGADYLRTNQFEMTIFDKFYKSGAEWADEALTSILETDARNQSLDIYLAPVRWRVWRQTLKCTRWQEITGQFGDMLSPPQEISEYHICFSRVALKVLATRHIRTVKKMIQTLGAEGKWDETTHLKFSQCIKEFSDTNDTCSSLKIDLNTEEKTLNFHFDNFNGNINQWFGNKDFLRHVDQLSLTAHRNPSL